MSAMTSLSASALDLDQVGCALLKAAVSRDVPRRSSSVWLRAIVGFIASTSAFVVVLVGIAAL